MNLSELTNLIRDVPDFPKPGILFKDITPLLASADGFRSAVELMAELISPHRPDALVAIESRGFIFGAALAMHMGLPLELVRKHGKLPYKTTGLSYDLEYGSDRVEMHVDAVTAGQRYAVIDDLVATGGTAAAAAELVELNQGVVACLAFAIELRDLNGRSRLGERPVHALLAF